LRRVPTLGGLALRRHIPLLAAAACLVGLVAVGLLALEVPAAHERDAAMLHGFIALDGPRVYWVMKVFTHLCNPLPYACVGLVIVGVAVVRGQTARALTAGFLLVATGATTHVLKLLLADPRPQAWLTDQLPATSWPSGHSTAAMTLALCAVLVAPPRLRAATALAGAALAVSVGYALLVLGSHYPSDVLGGYLVAGLWTSLAVAVLHRVEAPEPTPRLDLQPLLALGVGGAAIAVAAIAARTNGVTLYSLERPTVFAGALTIALLALVLVTTVSAASTRGGPRAR
jgi:membrane-associated phospholipid phosphatase